MSIFSETLKHLPKVEDVERIELSDAQGMPAGVIENKPGQSGSLAVYNYLLGKYDMDRRTNERRAWYEAYYTLQRVPDYPARYRRAVEAITVADVQRVARRYLNTLSTVVLRPPAAPAR